MCCKWAVLGERGRAPGVGGDTMRKEKVDLRGCPLGTDSGVAGGRRADCASDEELHEGGGRCCVHDIRLAPCHIAGGHKQAAEKRARENERARAWPIKAERISSGAVAIPCTRVLPQGLAAASRDCSLHRHLSSASPGTHPCRCSQGWVTERRNACPRPSTARSGVRTCICMLMSFDSLLDPRGLASMQHNTTQNLV